MRRFKPFRGQMSDSFRAAIFIILSGGFQDAYTYCCRGKVFANAQTGNIVLLSTALFRREWPVVLKYLIPVVSFLIGTAAAEGIHIRLFKIKVSDTPEIHTFSRKKSSFRIIKCILDGKPHIRRAHLSNDCAVVELHGGVDDALRMQQLPPALHAERSLPLQ